MKRYTIQYILILILTPFLITSCDMFDERVFKEHVNNGLTITSMKFNDDYTKISLTLDVTRDLNYVRLDNKAKVKACANDLFCHLVSPLRVAQPKVTSIKYIAPDEVKKSNLKVLVLVDLSQTSAVIDKEYEYVRKIYSMFCRENLFLAFMLPDGRVTNIVPATDYVVENYICIDSPIRTNAVNSHDSIDQAPKVQHAYLYRSVSHMLSYLSTRTGTTFDNAKYKDLVILSDGQVYDEETNLPIDPEHFVMQEHLINQSHNIPDNASIYYVNLSANNSNSKADNNMMRMLCMLSEGKFYNRFPGINFCSDILSNVHAIVNEYVVELSNPVGKIYYGNNKYIRLGFYSNDGKKLIAECYKDYVIGSIYNRQDVGSVSKAHIFFSGLLIALFVFILVYVGLQIIWPYISYKMFRKKYVAKYSGQNMILNGNMVADTCYYCKAPFVVGDTIVAKCKHTMHESCWEENDQHCPEHGKHCPEGSHFYDSENLFNPRNGSFYIKWVVVAMVVGVVQWMLFMCFNHKMTFDLLYAIIDWLSDDEPVSSTNFVETTTYVRHVSPRMFGLPLYGKYFASLLTMSMAYLAGYHRQMKDRIIDIVARGVIAGLIVYTAFLLEFMTVLVCNTYDGLYILDLIPWTITAYTIIMLSTYNSRIKIQQSMAVLASLAIGAMSAAFWTVFGIQETESEIVLLNTGSYITAIAIALVVARKLPHSEHYFLHVSGAVKDMDIALYKWLRQSPDATVTIGRSVDCALQLTWDIQADVAPVHASIKMHYGAPYLTAVDGSTFVAGKEIVEGESVRLYHGLEFQIGATVFIYKET